MNSKKLLLTFVAGFIVMFALSGLWYLVIMKGFYSEQFSDVQRPEFNMVWITVGYLIAAILLAYIYPHGYKGGPPMKEGMKFGLLMGLLMALPISLLHLGVYNVPLTGSLVDTLYQVVEKIAGGITIGLVYGKGSN